jgi:DHA1 family bicyclomycin/chloramphenicol resistance-like MFS transporter
MVRNGPLLPLKILSESPFRRDTLPSLALLVPLTMFGAMATHIFIPALPAAALDLHASPGAIQLTITLYLVGMATGQLIYGPLSDRFGRRPMVLAGQVFYVLACLLAAYADSIGALIVARVLQALGACSGLVLGRAMVRDGTTTEKAAGRLSVVMATMAVGPALAPILGGYIVGWAGWRGIFVLMALLGAIVLVSALLFLPESNRNLQPLPGLRPMLRNFRRLLGLRVFRGYAVGGCCVSTSMYAFFPVSPFLLINVLHQTPQQLGLYYLLIMAAVSGGGFSAGPLSRQFGMRAVALGGNMLQFIAAVGLLAVDLSGHLSVTAVLLSIVLVGAGAGIASPMTMAGAVSADLSAIGTASGLFGFMQMMFGALCSLVVSVWQSDSALPMATVLLVSAVVGNRALLHAMRAGKTV